jgi:hypothetical protein
MVVQLYTKYRCTANCWWYNYSCKPFWLNHTFQLSCCWCTNKKGKSAAVGGKPTPTTSLQTTSASITFQLKDYFEKALPKEAETKTTSTVHAAAAKKGKNTQRKKNPRTPAATPTKSGHYYWTLQSLDQYLLTFRVVDEQDKGEVTGAN